MAGIVQVWKHEWGYWAGYKIYRICIYIRGYWDSLPRIRPTKLNLGTL